MAQKNGKGTELIVFKGREARLNRAIFEILAIEGSQTMANLWKLLNKQRRFRTPYFSSLTKRMHCLEEAGYLVKTTTDQSRGSSYRLRPKAYLAAFFDTVSVEELLNQASDKKASILLLALLNTISLTENPTSPSHDDNS